MHPVIKRLLINLLKNLNDRMDNDSCNDLSENIKDEPLLEGISKKDFLSLQRDWARLFPEEAAELDNELIFNTLLVNYGIAKLEEVV